jgi:predicted lipase
MSAKLIDYSLHIMCAYYNRKAYIMQKDVTLNTFKNVNIIAFRGTNDLKSLSYSFDLRNHENRLHSGYNKYAQSCKDQLLDLDIDFRKKTYITGHSLGSLASVLVANDLDIEANIVLFGSPRLATDDFCQEIKKNTKLQIYNYINEYDIIADYPFFCYQHVTEAIILKNSKSYINPINYHSMRSYGHNLLKLKARLCIDEDIRCDVRDLIEKI